MGGVQVVLIFSADACYDLRESDKPDICFGGGPIRMILMTAVTGTVQRLTGKSPRSNTDWASDMAMRV